MNNVIEKERLINIDFGIDPSQDTLPHRFVHEPLKEGPSKGHVVPIQQMVKEYYKLKGWDERGIPQRKR
ncbi:MAG: hypothetical protein JRH08_15745 [Deltaproteobacteria bacterium]|nr:hypothetical protein [Deltaproteobacteria bacterium]